MKWVATLRPGVGCAAPANVASRGKLAEGNGVLNRMPARDP
jgi:hypothetical protein